MALADHEVMSTNGFVRDTNSQAIVLVTDTTNAEIHNGFLRDPDGRLVVR